MSDQLLLPIFEGHQPALSQVRFSGSVPFRAPLARPHRLGETVTLLVKGVVTNVGHAFDSDDLLIRGEAVRVELAEPVDIHVGIEMMKELDRQAHEAAGVPLLAFADPDTGEIEPGGSTHDVTNSDEEWEASARENAGVQ